MEFVLFKKVCPCRYVWVDGFRYKNLMPEFGMGRRLPFFLVGVRFRASIFDDLSYVYTIPVTAIISIVSKY